MIGGLPPGRHPYLELRVPLERPETGLRQQIGEPPADRPLRLLKLTYRYTGSGAGLGDQLPEQSLQALDPEQVLGRAAGRAAGALPPAVGSGAGRGLMRILAIRGANLVSLAEPFDLDFERPPPDGCRLCAISGPTAAGKSSLLYALGLALFDRMPRLPDGQRIGAGRADEDEALRLRSSDPRFILRRGAGAGFAEVGLRRRRS